MTGSHEPSAISHYKGLDLRDVAGLRTFRTVDDLELYSLAFLERTEPVALNGRVVHENVTASVTLDEPVALGVVEPFDLACDTHRSSSLLAVTRARVIEQKKRPRYAAFPFRRQARPASAQMILDFPIYAKSLDQRYRLGRYCPTRTRPRGPRVPARLYRRHRARARGGRPARERRVRAH